MGSSGEDEHYRMRWNDFQANVTTAFADIRDEQELFDVTLVAPGGRVVRAHKLVLSACSPMFKAMFRHNSHPQPMIFMHGVRYSMLNAILNYMYQGEVSVDQEQLDGFLAAAEGLQVRGFEQAWVNKKESFSNLEITKSPPPHLLAKKARLSKDGSLKSNVKTEPGTMVVTPDFAGATTGAQAGSDDDGVGGSTSSGLLHVTRGAGKVGDYYNHLHHGGFSTPHSGRGRRPSSVIDYSSKEGVSYHRLGGRDAADPISTMMVALTCKGWHCPECSHTATTKGNLKAHILSGRHKVSEKSFSCQYCQRNYSTRQSLQVHISTNHRFERDQEYKQEYQQQQQQQSSSNTEGGASSGGGSGGGGGNSGNSHQPPPPPSSTPATTAPSVAGPTQTTLMTSPSHTSSSLNKTAVVPTVPSVPAAAPHYLHHAAQLAASTAAVAGQQVPQPLLTPQQQYMQHYIQQQQSNAAAAAFHKDNSDVEVLAANYGANNM